MTADKTEEDGAFYSFETFVVTGERRMRLVVIGKRGKRVVLENKSLSFIGRTQEYNHPYLSQDRNL